MPYLASTSPSRSDASVPILGLSPDAKDDHLGEASEFSQEAVATATATTAAPPKPWPSSAPTPSTSSSSTATIVRHVGPRIDLLAPVGPTASAGRSSPLAPSFASPHSSPSPLRSSPNASCKEGEGGAAGGGVGGGGAGGVGGGLRLPAASSSDPTTKQEGLERRGAEGRVGGLRLDPAPNTYYQEREEEGEGEGEGELFAGGGKAEAAAMAVAMRKAMEAVVHDINSSNKENNSNNQSNEHEGGSSSSCSGINFRAMGITLDEDSSRRDMRFRPPGALPAGAGWVEADLDCDEARRSVEPRAGRTSRGASMGSYQENSPLNGPQMGLHPSRGQYEFDSGGARAGPRITSPAAVPHGEGDPGPNFGGTVIRRCLDSPEAVPVEAARTPPRGAKPAKSVHTVDWQTLHLIRADLCRIACLKAAARLGRDMPVDGTVGPFGPGCITLEQEMPVSGEDLVNSWVDIADREQMRLGSGPLPARDREFIEIRVAQSMREVDPQCTGYVDVDIWVHHMLLTRSSPTVMRAMLQLNRLLEVSMASCPGALVVLQHAFDVARHAAADAAPPQEGAFEIELCDASNLRNVRLPFREVISTFSEKLWHFRPGANVAEGHRPLRKTDFSHGTPELFIHNVVQALEVEPTSCICPGDFLGLCLGRREWEVTLHLYDLSKGLAATISPWLLPDALEGIWHTGIVVYGKEYYFGGDIYYDTPGETGFGKPRMSIHLGTTLCQRDELHAFVVEELKSVFTREAYDAASNNCNHFTDKVCMFLLGKHIPEEVLRQPELMLSTTLGRTLRPILTRLLGQYFIPKSSSEEITSDGGSPKAFSTRGGPEGTPGAQSIDHFDRTYTL